MITYQIGDATPTEKAKEIEQLFEDFGCPLPLSFWRCGESWWVGTKTSGGPVARQMGVASRGPFARGDSRKMLFLADRGVDEDNEEAFARLASAGEVPVLLFWCRSNGDILEAEAQSVREIPEGEHEGMGAFMSLFKAALG